MNLVSAAQALPPREPPQRSRNFAASQHPASVPQQYPCTLHISHWQVANVSESTQPCTSDSFSFSSMDLRLCLLVSRLKVSDCSSLNPTRLRIVGMASCALPGYSRYPAAAFPRGVQEPCRLRKLERGFANAGACPMDWQDPFMTVVTTSRFAECSFAATACRLSSSVQRYRLQSPLVSEGAAISAQSQCGAECAQWGATTRSRALARRPGQELSVWLRRYVHHHRCHNHYPGRTGEIP